MRPLFIVFLVWAAGCDEEPLDLERPGSGDGGAAGASGFDASRGSGGGADGAAARSDGGYRQALDEQVFADVITPILDRRCSGAPCHGRAPEPDVRFQIYGSPEIPPDQLTPEQLGANLEEVIAFIDFQDPPQSALLLKATSNQDGEPPHFVPRPALLEQSEDYATILAWIEAATAPPIADAAVVDAGAHPPADAGDVGPPPPPVDAGEPEPSVPCEALPDPAVRPRFDWVVFRGEVEPMLLASCAAGDCHAAPGSGGGLWLQTAGTVCASRWNFFTTLWFVDSREPSQSQILTQPLGGAEGLHGGRQVFADPDDPRYVLLAQWVVAAVSGE